LTRVRFGPITLGGLALGEWRELTDDEVRALRGAVGLGEA
jgi:16S rRNA U516 pseudouridylate synthase RsuA-like enzyme